jgi:MoxR-like ATPase
MKIVPGAAAPIPAADPAPAGAPVAAFERALQAELGKVVVGDGRQVQALALALLVRGHVLLQGVPGLGKTLLARSFAAATGGSFKRIQGTADLMPGDIIGVHVYDAAQSSFVFRRGPLFADVVLVDEINRAGPKTQSALLEAMEERQVSSEGEVFALPRDFMVIATQNPREFEGTYPLPESQLDRFLMRIDLSYPSAALEGEVLRRHGLRGAGTLATPQPLDAALLHAARAALDEVFVSPAMIAYVLAIAGASRAHPGVAVGLSTRGAMMLLRAARAHAGVREADHVAPDDVKAVAAAVVAHRLSLTPEAVLEGVPDTAVVTELLDATPVPR